MSTPGKHSGHRAESRRPRFRGRLAAGSDRPDAVTGSRRGLVLLSLLAVLVFAGAVVCAGEAPGRAGSHQPATRTAATGRDLSCAGGVPGARARVGTAHPEGRGSTLVDGEPLRDGATTPLGRAPLHVHADPAAAPWVHATRSAATPAWVAAAGCVQPRAEWWFVGAGGSQRHPSVLTLDNPREGTAVVDVEALGPRGRVKAPGLQGIQVRSRGSVRLDLAKVAPQVGDLAVHVTTVRGLVAASVAEQWSPAVVVKRSHEWVAPQPPAQRTQTLTGIPAGTPHATLLVSNPSDREAVVHLGLVKESGTFDPSEHDTVTVPPQTVRPVRLDDAFESAPTAIRVSAQVPVSSTLRTWSGGDDAYALVPGPVDREAVAGVPRGLSATLQLASTLAGGHARARVRVVARDGDGKSLARHTEKVAAAAASSLALPRRTASVTVRVLGGRPGGRHLVGAVLVHRGHHAAVVPLSSTATGTRVPVVRPGW